MKLDRRKIPIYNRPLITEELGIIENQLADCMRRLTTLRKAFYSQCPSVYVRSSRKRGMGASFDAATKGASPLSRGYERRFR